MVNKIIVILLAGVLTLQSAQLVYAAKKPWYEKTGWKIAIRVVAVIGAYALGGGFKPAPNPNPVAPTTDQPPTTTPPTTPTTPPTTPLPSLPSTFPPEPTH